MRHRTNESIVDGRKCWATVLIWRGRQRIPGSGGHHRESPVAECWTSRRRYQRRDGVIRKGNITLIWRHKPHTTAAAVLLCHRQTIGRAVQVCTHGLWPTTKQPYAALVCRLMVSTPVIHAINDPGEMEGWAGLDGWPIADSLPSQWSPVNSRSVRESPPAKDRRPHYLSHATNWTLSGIRRKRCHLVS